ncbi:MAG: hypothetical protein OEW92_01280 [Gammaproteobacteria bacterium]|jgi:hypothetical protein|nr:hypothetical protein [Gammaproteobacteria bacterium]MDH5171022.1 hypothetical protein [Gammaproteobacteria bacterium]
MTERNQDSAAAEPLDDFFEPVLGDISEDEMQELIPISTEKQRLAAKRRRAEQRLEERRLRDELGYYDLRLDDY